ncbi:tetratricopeptide repeat protein [Bdellovibrio sp. HCB274]|uniref:tetratricopeptide repeat protein n=1 Tax=Bdellovibrio sp. HCB274 TaxID=3394361 RepID=UPI0039B3C0DC
MKQLGRLATTLLLSLPLVTAAKSTHMPKNAAPTSRQQALLVELTGQDFSKQSDTELYAEMISASQRDDEIGLKSRMQSLLTRFPASTYADNALFLAGRMAVDHGNFPEAIRLFGRIEKNYPNSDKAASAKFAKAMTYKKMNLPQFAKRSLSEVRSKYPGSPESFRADAELKLFN